MTVVVMLRAGCGDELFGSSSQVGSQARFRTRLAVRLLSRGAFHFEAVLEAEGQVAFGGDAELFAAGERLSAGTGCASSERANGCAFAAAGDRADEGPGRSTAADVLAGSRVFADTLLLIAGLHVRTVDGVAYAVRANGAQINGEGVVIANGGELSAGTSRDKHVAIAAEHVFTDGSAIHVRGVSVLDVGVDGFVGADGDLGSARNCGALRDGGYGWAEDGKQEHCGKLSHVDLTVGLDHPGE
jgi:hypothetical protein